MDTKNDIAIVGMSCIFPGAKNLDIYWQNIINKIDSIREAPETRISKVYFDPESGKFDRLYCLRGGFIDDLVDFNPIEFGIVPNTVKGTEPDQLLSLKLAYRALEDADMLNGKISHQKSGIIVGRGNYGGNELMKLAESIIGGEQLVQNLRFMNPLLSEADLLLAKMNYQDHQGNFSPQNAMGTVPNMIASLVANRLDFEGPAYTVDAACASSLLAIDNAVKELRLKQCDTMLAGAIHTSQSPVLWSVFCMLGAFSRKQAIRPFDKRADGILPGEGGGFVVLRRLEDAIKDNQRIYAVLKNVGISSDGASASLMSPSSKGQVKALKNAWSKCNCNPQDIGYLEAHGTGTILGDKVEIETLHNFFGENNHKSNAWLGSVKSMIGHTMPAAGIAGFIKTVLALYFDKIPPTLHCEQPLEEIFQTRFRPVENTLDWSQTGLPKIAGVNAFGFGGINAHAILTGFNSSKTKRTSLFTTKISNNEEVVLLARNSANELISALKKGDYSIGKGKHRLVVFNPDDVRIEKAIRIVQKGNIWRGRLDIWYTYKPLFFDLKNKMAFVFPGFDGQTLSSLGIGEFQELSEIFDLPSPKYTHCDEGIEVNLGINESCRLINDALKKLSIEPDVICGHSMGEWTACYTSSLVNKDVAKKLEQKAIKRGLDKVNALLLSVNTSLTTIKKLLNETKNIYVTADNCPQQIILCGLRVDVEKFQKVLTREGILFNVLPFQTLYHTPFAKKYLDDVKSDLEDIVQYFKTEIPLWSCITASPYPKNAEEIKQLQLDFMVNPVRFRELIRNLYDDGVRYFLQIGAGSTKGFINATLEGMEFASVASGSTKQSAFKQLKRVVASLFIEGKDVNLSILNLKKGTSSKLKGFSQKLDLSFSFLPYEKALPPKNISASGVLDNKTTQSGTEQLLREFNKNILHLKETQAEFIQYLTQNNNLTPEPDLRLTPAGKTQHNSLRGRRIDFSKRINLSLATYPELRDHCPFTKRSVTDNFSKEEEPIVPFTTYYYFFIDLLKEYYPDIKIVKITNTKVYQFLWVNKVPYIEVVGTWINFNTIQFVIDKYARATCIVDVNDTTSYPDLKLSGFKTPPIQASDIYKKGYMFHGPHFQGIKKIIAYAENGIEVQISGAKGKGAMLDNIGQAISLYYHFSGKNITAYPVAVKEIKFEGDPTDTEGTFNCICVYKRRDEEFLYADIVINKYGIRWAYIVDWQIRRSEIDDPIFKFFNRAEGRYLSKVLENHLAIMPRKYNRLNTWFTILNQYCNKSEMKVYNSFSPSRQKNWLLGRIAAKDAIRIHLQKEINLKIHPASITIFNEATGQPCAVSKMFKNMNISISHKEEYGVAYASMEKPVGIDIEKIINEPESLYHSVLNKEEKVLMADMKNEKEWFTRFWVAKEAYGKMLGKGLRGNPKQYKISGLKGETLRIENVEIKTLRFENYIIGYTL
jgi:3-oxoacyl-(acyl-carrier-protein) synthase/phosphopantetheinyl transferase